MSDKREPTWPKILFGLGLLAVLILFLLYGCAGVKEWSLVPSIQHVGDRGGGGSITGSGDFQFVEDGHASTGANDFGARFEGGKPYWVFGLAVPITFGGPRYEPTPHPLTPVQHTEPVPAELDAPAITLEALAYTIASLLVTWFGGKQGMAWNRRRLDKKACEEGGE